MPQAVSRAAPAKINLALHVTGRRADGYHLLDSLVAFTAFGDRIGVEAATSDTFFVSGPYASQTPADGSNLAMGARDLLRTLYPDATKLPVNIVLDKQLPVASGIGGGSSDAAAALKALVAHWGIEDEGWKKKALELGADLPMCLAARPLIARGIGEELEPLRDFPALQILLVNPGAAVPTPQVFARLERRDNTPLPPLPPVMSPKALLHWLETTRNDLEAPARDVAPAIGEALSALRGSNAMLARMSGSGATCFGLFADAASAQDAAARIARTHPGWFVVATETRPSPQGEKDFR